MPGVEVGRGAVAGMPLSGGVAGSVGADLKAKTLGPGAGEAAWRRCLLGEHGILWATRGGSRMVAGPVVSGGGGGWAGASRGGGERDGRGKALWPGQDPIGKRIGTEWEQGAPWYEVVAMSKSTRDYALDLPARPAMYVPMEQMRRFTPQFLTVRTAAAPKTFAGPLRQAVERGARTRAFYVLVAMQELLDNSVAQRRFGVVTLGVFGAMALILAAAGIYGVVSYSVTRRTQEIGCGWRWGRMRRTSRGWWSGTG